MNKEYKKTLDSWAKLWKKLPHPLRWFFVMTMGLTLVVTGIVFMVLPGPGIPLVIAGLAILATEFAWAEVLLHKTKHHSNRLLEKAKLKKKK